MTIEEYKMTETQAAREQYEALKAAKAARGPVSAMTAEQVVAPIRDEPEPGPVVATQMPVPTTYHLLCGIPEVGDRFDSGLVKAGQTIHNEEILSPVLFVLAMGPDAYGDKTRFPSGPSCKVGDFVLVRPNTGTRIKIHSTELRIINDDSVEAVVDDPRGIKRA